MKEHHKLVYDYIKNNPLCSKEDIADYLNCGLSKAVYTLNELRLIVDDITVVTLEKNDLKLGAPRKGFVISSAGEEKERHGIIMDYVKKKPYSTAREIASGLNLNYDSLRRAIREMLPKYPNFKRHIFIKENESFGGYQYYIDNNQSQKTGV